MFSVYANSPRRPDEAYELPKLTEQAYNSLKQLICTNTFGREFVLEQDLANRLSMSRTPVREASIRLAAEGLLEIRPRRGIRQVALPQSAIRELYELVHHISRAAVLEIAGQSGSAAADLRAACFLWDLAARENDPKAFAKQEALFFAQLLDMSGKRLMSRVLQTAIVHLGRIWHAIDALPNRAPLVVPGAIAIVDALLAADKLRAPALLAQLCSECSEYILGVLSTANLDAV